MNSQIKARVHSRSTLPEILQIFQDIEERILERSEQEQRNEARLILNHPMLNEIYDIYTRYAFELMLNEYMNSHESIVQRETPGIAKGIEAGTFIVRDNGVKYKVEIRCKGATRWPRYFRNLIP
jgi:hypothetical protein